LQDEYQTPEIQLGYLDINLLEMILDEQTVIEANKTKINFIVENKKVILLMMCYLPVVVFDQH
jgi:pyrimidine operon attenuation protein/uracil phosphoribosyltransferase